eukprot:879696-Rhodomonas_salina.2
MLGQLRKAMCILFGVFIVCVPGAIVNVLEISTFLIRPFSRSTFRKINKFLISLHWPILVW